MKDADGLKVLNFVRRALVEAPGSSVGELYKRAGERYPVVQRLDRRQFNARFILRAKRELGFRRFKGARLGKDRGHGGDARTAGPTGSGLRKEPDAEIPRTGPAPRPEHAHDSAPDPEACRRVVRDLLMEFAGEVVETETHADVVHLFMRLDGYVDRMFESCRGL